MATQKFMGANQLLDRLTAQIGDRDLAIRKLRERGHMETYSLNLTAAGRARDAMTAEERALDRAARRTGKPLTAFTYNPSTNTVRKNR
jgi:hypothetical protein